MLTDICESHGILPSGNKKNLHADYTVTVDRLPGCVIGLGLIQVIHSLFVVLASQLALIVSPAS